MTLSPRDRRAVILGGAALAALAIGYWVVVPWLGDWADARDSIGVGRARLEEVESKLRRLAGQRERLAEAFGPGACRPLEGVEATRIGFLKTVQDACRSAGIGELNCQPQPTRPLRELPEAQLVSIQVSGKCQIGQLARCLAALRACERVTLVDRLVAAGNERQPGQLEVTLVLATLARKGP